MRNLLSESGKGLVATCLVNTNLLAYRYIGDEHGLMSVVKYDTEERTLLRLPYHTTANAVTGSSFLFDVLPIDCYYGCV